MSKRIAVRENRTVKGFPYFFLYNPMWGHFGDRRHDEHPPSHPQHEPPGTCYYSPRESKWFYWQMLDQVLLRPDLLPFFRNEDLRILTSDGTNSLLTKQGLPDRDRFPTICRSCFVCTFDRWRTPCRICGPKN